MPRPASYGRTGTPVIPDGWESTHGAVIAATFNCTVTIGPAGTGTAWNPTTHQTETTDAALVYDGPADIGPAGINDVGGETLAAEEQVDLQRLEVKIPRDAAAAVVIGHVINVTASTNPALVGGRLVVTDLERADRGFSRVIFAQYAD